MSAPDPLPETGGVFHRDATGALIPGEPPATSETEIAPEAPAKAPLKKDRNDG